jgi:hypothetical protein
VTRLIRDKRGRPLTPADKTRILRKIDSQWDAYSHKLYVEYYKESPTVFLNKIRYALGLDPCLNDRPKRKEKEEIEYGQCAQETFFGGQCSFRALVQYKGEWLCVHHAKRKQEKDSPLPKTRLPKNTAIMQRGNERKRKVSGM